MRELATEQKYAYVQCVLLKDTEQSTALKEWARVSQGFTFTDLIPANIKQLSPYGQLLSGAFKEEDLTQKNQPWAGGQVLTGAVRKPSVLIFITEFCGAVIAVRLEEPLDGRADRQPLTRVRAHLAFMPQELDAVEISREPCLAAITTWMEKEILKEKD